MDQPSLEGPLGSLCLTIHLTSYGRTVTLVMKKKPGRKVEKIFGLIQRDCRVPVNDQLLFYRGQQLDPHFIVASHISEKNVVLHLVPKKLRDEEPVAWQRIVFLGLQIKSLLEGDHMCGPRSRVGVLQYLLRAFLDMTLKSDDIIREETLTSRMSIFGYVGAPALVSLYFSQSEYKMAAEELIRTFLSSCVPTFHSVCAPVVLEFCTLLGKCGSKDDPLYTICRSTLGMLILTYANRGGDYKWIIGQKDHLDFECRKHLLMLMFPDVNAEDAVVNIITVERDELLIDSLYEIMEEYPVYLRGELLVEFTDEEATGPGVLREWFILVSQDIFNPDNALFNACPNDRRKFFPNPASSDDPLHHTYFEFAGRFIALAIIHSVSLGIMFDRAFFLQLAGVNISLEDIKDADPEFYSSCKQILDMDPVTVDQDALGLTFVDEFEGTVVELCDNGETTVVNSGNRHEYIQLLIMQRFVTCVSEKVDKFAKGFSDIVGNRETVELFFKTLELEEYNELLHGSEAIISVEEWKAHTDYHGYTETDPQICWFWKVVEEMTDVQKRNLLFFWTSILYLPPAGFGGIDSRLKIHKTNNSINHLPTSATCFHMLKFPPYPSLEEMRQRLEIITRSFNGFAYGLA